LCELGAPASAEYLSFIEADIEEGQKQLRWSAGFLYGLVIPAAWIFTPAFFICTVLTWSRLRSLRCSRRQRVVNNAIESPGRRRSPRMNHMHLLCPPQDLPPAPRRTRRPSLQTRRPRVSGSVCA
jgi:hypothetical protein